MARVQRNDNLRDYDDAQSTPGRDIGIIVNIIILFTKIEIWWLNKEE